MPVYTKEDKILLAIDAIASVKAVGKRGSVLYAAKTYGVPESSLYDRMND